MSFDTLEFARFLPVVLLGYYFLPFRAQNVWLLGASYVFYASWEPAFVLLLLFSTLLDYGCAWAIEIASSSRRRRRFLLLSLVGNLGVLATFKYLGFFVDSAMGLLERVGLDVSRPVLEIALPVGISFYTFQTMAYTIDVYRGHQRASRNLLDFALYVSFFPQLVAGPIERARSLLPQIATPRVVTNRHLREGAFLVLWGLFKKIGLSNAMAPMVDAAYGPAGGASMSELWRALYLFAFQVYFDFSGYSDIARGCARLLGVELMENFHQPFLARNLADFWRRWHVSFSTWLRDYVYVPLGGSRGGAGATSRNLVITLAISGLWHGAAWKFVIWGFLHGVLLAAERRFLRRDLSVSAAPPAPGWSSRVAGALLVFHVFALLLVLFRARDLGHAGAVYGGLLGASVEPGMLKDLWPVFFYAALVLAIDLVQERGGHCAVLRWPLLPRSLAMSVMLVFILVWSWGLEQPFFYFQF